MNTKTQIAIALAALLLTLIGCAEPEPQTVEVTREVEVQQTVEVPKTVEVTREVTKVVEKVVEETVEVTRIEEVVVTATTTPTPLNSPTPTNTPTVTPTPSNTHTPTSSPTLTPTPDMAATATAEAWEDLTAPKGDGFYLVGIEIAPGLWQSQGTGDGCYWERLDSNQEIIDNHYGQAGGTVRIRPTDFEVHFEDCGTWEYLGQ